MAANSGQLVQALIGGGVSPAAARVIANALANSNTPQFSSSRDLSDQTPAEQLRLITPDTRRYQLTNLDYSREQPYQSALESYPGRYVPETTDHPYKDSQPVLPAPPLSAPRILGGQYVDISDATTDGAQQTRVGLKIARNTGLHLRANQATNSLDVVSMDISAPQGLVTAEVVEESDKTTIQIQVRGIASRSVVLHDGTTARVWAWDDPSSTASENTFLPLVNPGEASLLPAGIVVAAARELPVTYWLMCNGQAVSRTTYSNLFTAIGTSYGSGNGTTTFNVPDYRGYFLRGFGTHTDGTASGTFGIAQGMATARPTTAFTTSDPGNHTHTSPAADTASGTGPNHGEMTNAFSANIATSAAGAHTHTITGGGDAETRPKNIAVHYYIKT